MRHTKKWVTFKHLVTMYKMSQISENKLQCEKWLAVRKMSHTVNQRIPEPAHG